jgi:hypothetical protein
MTEDFPTEAVSKSTAAMDACLWILLGMLLVARLPMGIEFQPLSSTAVLLRMRWRVLSLQNVSGRQGTAAPRAYVASMLFMYTVKEMCVGIKQTTINEKIGLTFTAWGETEEEPERVWERQKLRPT